MGLMRKLSKKGWQFSSIVALLSVVPYYFIVANTNSDSVWTLVLMWIPAMAAVLMRLWYKEGFFTAISWNPLKDFKWIFVAALIPLLIELLSLLIIVTVNAAELRPDFFHIQNGIVTVKGISMLFGAQPQPWYLFIFNYLSSYFIGVLLYGIVFAFGEEYGWRGYLQKEWSPDNKLIGFVGIGVIWGFWHLPAVLQGHNYPEYPILGALVLMPLMCILLSIAFGISYSRKKVVWIPVVFHGALNIGTDVSGTALLPQTINETLTDLIWSSLWAITTLLFWFRFRKHRG